MKNNILGIDIGGTKCAVTYGIESDGNIEIADKVRFATEDVNATIEKIKDAVKLLIGKHSLDSNNTRGIGISCGGPLSSRKGLVLSPPNLPGWDRVPIVNIIQGVSGMPAHLQNDANACAWAEYKFGAGRGTQNMVFLTFGTGLGAGIIIDGRLYAGTNDNAGEVGHVRLADFGPVGYGKRGSFEGFASGSGIAQLARTLIMERMQMGEKISWCSKDELPAVTAKKVAEEAAKGDELALEIIGISADYLGRGIAMLIDILNPEVVVIGSIFTRCENLFRRKMQEAINREALPGAAKVCEVRPAMLGDSIGDYAALSLACM